MATRLGACSQDTACECCAPSSGLQCRTRGGTATVCGYSEFTSASSPPKKYRTITFSGNTLVCTYTSGTCLTTVDSAYSTYSGGRSYDSATCVESSFTDRYTFAGAPGCAATGGSANGSGSTPHGWDAPGGITDTAKTATVWSQDGDGICGAPGSNKKRPTGNVRTQTLTNEDTEQNAIDRLLAGGGGTWGSFTTVGDGTGGTCLATSCCNAKYQARTSLFTFAYQQSEWRVSRSGLRASTNYRVTLTYYRRLYGTSDAWVAYATYDGTASSNASGVMLTTGVAVPITRGYETHANDLILCKMPG